MSNFIWEKTLLISIFLFTILEFKTLFKGIEFLLFKIIYCWFFFFFVSLWSSLNMVLHCNLQRLSAEIFESERDRKKNKRLIKRWLLFHFSTQNNNQRWSLASKYNKLKERFEERSACPYIDIYIPYHNLLCLSWPPLIIAFSQFLLSCIN